jgi:hypothetical protein
VHCHWFHYFIIIDIFHLDYFHYFISLQIFSIIFIITHFRH